MCLSVVIGRPFSSERPAPCAKPFGRTAVSNRFHSRKLLCKTQRSYGESGYTQQPQRLDNVAGVGNEKVNVFGLMLHPERASESILGSQDGRVILENILAAVPVK
jgi:phosphoribosylformylglycinamidine (FGAM) synthase-like amidotransferase family enzyme